MKTPIFDFVKKYNDENYLRLHMPGHKGKSFENSFTYINSFDITEIKGADSLFECDGIIAESEKNASELFNTEATIFSTGGSTLCIQTMLTLVAKPGTTVIATRNAHKAFINTCALLDLDVNFIYPSNESQNNTIISYNYSLDDIERAIVSCENPSSVYITSPDYYGRLADIRAIAELAHKYKLPLLVDNAHGAHLAFMNPSLHPISLGADICCDSAHKMLPVLTGGAYLHFKDTSYIKRAKDIMAVYGSTSPSYLIMTSLDLCNQYLDTSARDDIKRVTALINKFKNSLNDSFVFEKSEPFHLTILSSKNGVNGNVLAEFLRSEKIECEYSDDYSIVFLFSPISSKKDFEKLYVALLKSKRICKKSKTLNDRLFYIPERKMSLRNAMFSECETIRTECALGRICAYSKVTCPPGIAVVTAGEIIDRDIIILLKKYSIKEITVVK